MMDDDDDPDVVFPRTVAADGSDDAEDATTRIIIKIEIDSIRSSFCV